MNNITTFHEAIHATLGYSPDPGILTPGKMIRFATSGRRGDEAGWCKLFDDGEGGIFGCWRRGISETWQSRIPDSLEERTVYAEHIRKAREEAAQIESALRAECRRTSATLWQQSHDVDTKHPYLVAKAIKPYGIRQLKESLLVPVKDASGILHGVQFIGLDGSKKFKAGTAVTGCFHAIEKPNGTLLIAEGFATSATLHEITGHAVACTFNAGNMKPVAEALRINLPDTILIFCADDDHTTEGNPGLTKASEAAQAVDGLLAIPVFPDNRGDKDTDFNDLARLAGPEAVKRCIEEAKALRQERDEYPNNGKEQERKDSKTERLIRLALDNAELFHDGDLKAYATIQREGHRETYPLRSKGFKTWLSGIFWKQYHKGCGGQVVQDALGTIEAHAIHEGACHTVHVRLAEKNKQIYLDLGNDRREVVELSSSGWCILKNQNIVKFRRPPGMAELPYPTQGGTLDALRKYVNLENKGDWPLIVGFLIGCFHSSGPYPNLAVTGEQGSAKSTLLRILKMLADPNSAPLRSLPKELRDLAISANNSWILAFDNLSVIPGWLSDGLCKLATGGGFSTRTLYSDDEETIFETKRPVMMNGIDNVIRNHDLADRAIVINLAVIPEDKRIPEQDFWTDFEDDAPEILGAVLEAVSCAIKNVNTVKLSQYPRMADFAKWVTAAEPELGWPAGTFMKAYRANRDDVTSMTLDADLLGTVVKRFMEDRDRWKGTMSDLLKELEGVAEDQEKHTKEWPKAANVLSGRLKRSATSLRSKGVEVSFGRTNGISTVTLEQRGKMISTIPTDAGKDVHVTDITDDSSVEIRNNPSALRPHSGKSICTEECSHTGTDTKSAPNKHKKYNDFGDSADSAGTFPYKSKGDLREVMI